MRKRAGSFLEQYSQRPAGRMLTVFPDDTFLVSYPKSGNTWVRFLLASLLSADGSVDLLEMEERVPMIYHCTNAVLCQKLRPRVIGSHECFDPRYGRVIYIVRDPRDTVISSYHHHLKARDIPEGYAMDLFVPRWLSAALTVGNVGTWREHVLSWTATRGDDPGFLLIRYEDLKRDSRSELDRVTRFLGVGASPQKLACAVEGSSPERMRELERQQHELWVRTKGTRADVGFVRNATAGGWKSVLSEASLAKIESECGAVMKSLGYQLSKEADGGSVQTLVMGASA